MKGRLTVAERMEADKRLLILDDDLMVGGMIALVADSAGWECKSTDEPHLFFSLLEELQPTHIVLDLAMTKMLEFLPSAGCERAQGYLIARPMEAETALNWYCDHALVRV